MAPKPHQDNIIDIDEFEWRFCVNYILLDMITKPVQFSISRCDDAVFYGMGIATFYVLWDAFSGYYQIRLAENPIPKTVFFAPHGRKYVYIVMPFGLKNAPAVFTAMMYDLRQEWTELYKKKEFLCLTVWGPESLSMIHLYGISLRIKCIPSWSAFPKYRGNIT